MVIKYDVLYPHCNEYRKLHIYLPGDYAHSEARYPVMDFFDGHNLFFNEDATYGKSWGLLEFLEGWEKDMIIVGMECSHTGNQRLWEYLPYPGEIGRFGELKSWGVIFTDGARKRLVTAEEARELRRKGRAPGPGAVLTPLAKEILEGTK